MAKPKALFLDEPCAGLDPVARASYLAFMENNVAKPKGPALILVTHHIEEIAPGFTHALLLREGSVVASGPKEEILTSANLSVTFDTSVRLRRKNDWYSMTLAK